MFEYWFTKEKVKFRIWIGMIASAKSRISRLLGDFSISSWIFHVFSVLSS
jgi:hypothetical protein